ncbi:MAG: hypothetical protein J5915_08870 [Acidaminococcaceae bacterium]|nr:hypothetical protein [Acidaminococcaceae bacterium]
MGFTEEQSKFDAQKNKLQGICEEHDLVYSLNVEQYPIVLTISKATKQYEQQSLIPEDKPEKPAIDPDAKIVWIFKETKLFMKVEGGTFTIGKELRMKIENIFLKLVNYWNQYYFRDTQEKNMLKKGKYPEIPEGDETQPTVAAPDEEEQDEEFEDDSEEELEE